MELSTTGLDDFLPKGATVSMPPKVYAHERAAISLYLSALNGIVSGRKFDYLHVDFKIFGQDLDVSAHHSDDLGDDPAVCEALQSLGKLTYQMMRLDVKQNDCLSRVEPGRPSHIVFTFGGNADKANLSRDADTSKRLKDTLNRLRKSGREREIMLPPKDWRKKIAMLEAEFPNFERVIGTIVRPHLDILEKGGRHRMSPVLLVGLPGIGKTFFANALAKTLGFPRALFIDFSAETNGSALSGSSVFWGNTQPGKLFEYLASGDGFDAAFANPVIILDEIDKTSANRYDPLAGLYSLLEWETAQRFKDQSIPDVWLDVSRARFFLTANDASKIPAPLLSRMTVFHIEPPSKNQIRGVIRNIYSDLVKEIALDLSPRLGEEIIDLALEISPREGRVRLECAIASAVSDGRKTVKICDWPEIPTAASQQRRGIGFMG
jgi:hypothetical protein